MAEKRGNEEAKHKIDAIKSEISLKRSGLTVADESISEGNKKLQVKLSLSDQTIQRYDSKMPGTN